MIKDNKFERIKKFSGDIIGMKKANNIHFINGVKINLNHDLILLAKNKKYDSIIHFHLSKKQILIKMHKNIQQVYTLITVI